MAAIGLTLQEMRDLVRLGLGNITATDLTDVNLDNYLRMAFWEIEATWPFKEKECRLQFALTIAENMYELPQDDDTVDLEALQSVGILDDASPANSSVLTRMSQSWWDTVYDHQNTDAHALPRRYVRMDETIILWPTPDKAYTLRLFFLKSLSALFAVAGDTPNLPREWHQIIVQKAIAKGHFFSQEYTLAQQAESITVGLIRAAVPVEAKEERDSHYAGLQVLREEPSGSSGMFPR